MLDFFAVRDGVSVAVTAAMIVFMFVFPAIMVWLTKKVKIFGVIGAVALCYLAGFLFALTAIPYDKTLTQMVASVMVAVAIPLILFSINLKSVKQLAGKTLVSFALVIVCTMIVSSISFVVANAAGMKNASQLAGMTTGVYIGGTPNLYFVGSALLTGENANAVIAAANTSDFFIGGVYFLLLLTVMSPLYKRFLGQKKMPAMQAGGRKTDAASDEEAQVVSATVEEYDFKSIPRDKRSVWRLIGTVALATGCLAIGAGLNLFITGSLDQTLYLLVAVSVLGVVFSFIRPVRETKGSYQVGQYMILIFSLGLSMSIDISVLVAEIMPTFLFFACTQAGCILLHLLLCKLFHIDGGTAIITSTAGVYGPPFIAPVANTFGDKQLIAPGVICGAIGLALGNFFGLGVGVLLGLSGNQIPIMTGL